MRIFISMRSLYFLLVPLLAASSLGARELTLLGLADLRGPSTFRSIRKPTEGLTTDESRRGLRAGIEQNEDDQTIAELRAVFRPTIFFQNVAFKKYTVQSVGMQLGGGMGEISMVTQNWSSNQDPAEIFDLPTASITATDLTTIFQEVLDRRGDGSSLPGFMISSSQPIDQQGPYHVRFSVNVSDAVAWTLLGNIRFILEGGSIAQKRVVEFTSSRRGVVTLTVNSVVRSTGLPVAAGHTYRLDLPRDGDLVVGTNTVLVTVTDPSDGTSQSLSLTFTR